MTWAPFPQILRFAQDDNWRELQNEPSTHSSREKRVCKVETDCATLTP